MDGQTDGWTLPNILSPLLRGQIILGKIFVFKSESSISFQKLLEKHDGLAD